MRKISLFSLSALFVLLVSAPAAYAHESRTYEIDGVEYSFTVGSLGEPLVVDDKSGIDLTVTKEGEPLDGAAEMLKVEVGSGNAKKTFDLAAAWGSPGKYETTFFLTTPDPLSYRLFGTLESKAVDLLFECAPAGHDMSAMGTDTSRVEISEGVTLTSKRGGFGCPAGKSTYQFPDASGDQLGLLKKTNLAVGLGAAGLLSGLVAIFLGLRAGGNPSYNGSMNTSIVFGVIGVLLGLAAGYLFFNTPTSAGGQDAPQAMGNMDHSAMAHPMLEVDPSKPVPSVSLEAVRDSKDGYNLHIVIQNFSFSPENVGGSNEPNAGHAHLYVNGVKVARLYGEWFNLSASDLKEGENAVEVTLNANDHSEWTVNGEHISARTTVVK